MDLKQIAVDNARAEFSPYYLSASEQQDILRYYTDHAYRESLPCGECGKTGGCVHFPKP